MLSRVTVYALCLRAHAPKILCVMPLGISEIAYEAGFGSIRSFNREFKELYGVCPAEFLQRVQKE